MTAAEPIPHDGELAANGLSGPAVPVRRLPVHFVSDDRRVITRPFLPGSGARLHRLFERVGALSEQQVVETLSRVRAGYRGRHADLEAVFAEHFKLGAGRIHLTAEWSAPRRQLVGAFLTMEYAVESAALFNPSIVPHPDQQGVPAGGLRVVISLRATGEGHVSSIVFRTGVIDAEQQIAMADPAQIVSRARISPDRTYLKHLFQRKLREMAVNGGVGARVLGDLPDTFTLDDLQQAVQTLEPELRGVPGARETIDAMLWLARSNYQIKLTPRADLSELVMFPMSDDESQGIEDLRLVRFVNDDGTVTYFGTYTAYNGQRVLPMMIGTTDFRRIEVHSLNGACATNKGMALFPRRIGGHYVMCSRIDGENLYISYSDYVHFWESAEQLAVPQWPWELVQIGNCGSPLETPEGWLLLTHGVGPMRTYCIGAMLLDRDDPLKVIGHLKQPLLAPVGAEREGYVPNVVYSCGALIHRDHLYLPYALADKSARIAVVSLDELLNRLLDKHAA